MKVEVFKNPSLRKVPVRLKYKAYAYHIGQRSSSRWDGIGYGSTRAIARKRAIDDYKRKHRTRGKR